MASLVTVSIVFTDVVDSTARSERVGPEAAETDRRSHFDLLRAALGEHDGREVKNLGDGLMIAFPSIGAAVAGTVAMHQAVERAGRNQPDPIRMRASVATGDAEEEDGDYFGSTVVEAARLCALAAPGQILAAAAVPILVGTRGNHRFLSLGEKSLKGIERPIEVFEVPWTPLGAEAATVPLPPQVARPVRVSRVGRPEAVAAMDTTWKAVRAGERQTVLIAGEAGMGKTRLASDFARAAHSDGGIVLFGRCAEDVGSPYQPFVEALGPLVENQDVADLASHVERHGTALARLVPDVAHRLGLEPPPQRDGESERYAVMAAAGAYLATTSASAPVVLIIDDLHWADPSSLHMVRHLLTMALPARLMVVGTYRDTDLSARDALTGLLADLHREDDVTRIPLRGLNDDDMVDLLEGLTGHSMDETGIGLAHALGRETNGNPFFAIEMLRHLAESDAVYQRDDGRWALRDELSTIGLPESVREVVGRRIGRLGPDVQRVLGLAAVIGREFDLELLEVVSEVPIDTLIDVLESAETAGIVAELPTEPGRYSFAHALIEHTLYDDLSGARRQRAHEKVGLALEELCGGAPGERIGELAHHWSAASRPADPAKAIAYGTQAGWRALAQNAPDDALGWFRRALDLETRTDRVDPASHIDLLVGLGQAQRDAGDAAHRETLLDAARQAHELGDAARLARAVLTNTRSGDATAVDDVERRDLVRLALDAVGEDPSPERARLLATLASTLPASEVEQRRTIAFVSHEVARALDDPETLLAVLNKTGTAIARPGSAAEQLVLNGEAMALARTVGDDAAEFTARYQRANLATVLADRAELDASVERCRELADQIGQPVMKWQADLIVALRALLDGDVAGAERWGEQALVHGSAEPEALPAWGGQMVELRRVQGRLEEVIDLFRDVASDPVVIDEIVRAVIAAIHAELGDLDLARPLIAHASESGFELPKDHLWTSVMIMYGESVAILGEAEDAHLLHDMLLPHASEVATSTVTVVGLVSSTLSRLALVMGDAEGAVTHAERSLELARRLIAPYWTARAQILLAEARQRVGGTDAFTAALLEEATATIAAHGFDGLRPLVERVHAEGAS